MCFRYLCIKHTIFKLDTIEQLNQCLRLLGRLQICRTAPSEPANCGCTLVGTGVPTNVHPQFDTTEFPEGLGRGLPNPSGNSVVMVCYVIYCNTATALPLCGKFKSALRCPLHVHNDWWHRCKI